jgi:hypothetical protein
MEGWGDFLGAYENFRVEVDELGSYLIPTAGDR